MLHQDCYTWYGQESAPHFDRTETSGEWWIFIASWAVNAFRRKDVGCDFAQLCSGNRSDYRLTDEGHFVSGVAIFAVDMCTD